MVLAVTKWHVIWHFSTAPRGGALRMFFSDCGITGHDAFKEAGEVS